MNLLEKTEIQQLLEGHTPQNRKRREDALLIMSAALTAVDPAQAVLNRLAYNPASAVLTVGEYAYDLNYYKRVFVIGAGKAAAPMAGALAQLLGERVTDGAINVKYAHLGGAPVGSKIAITEAGHPILDMNGVAGTKRIAKLLKATTPEDLVIAVMSGGGSALLELPVEGVTLEDMQALTAQLLKTGATINQLNTIRKHLSQVKGGNLARMAYPATLVSLILSDVVGSPLDVIASGATVPDTSTFAQAWNALEQFGLTAEDKGFKPLVPEQILKHLQLGVSGAIPETPKPTDSLFANTRNIIVGDNRVAAQAAAQKAGELGYNTLVLSTFVEGEAREVARVLAGVAKEIASYDSPIPKPACLLAGGETTVTIRGDGKGGRNQELALAAALALEGLENVLCLPLATDGSDGPTDAAGALVDGHSVSKARAIGLDALTYLAQNDSYHFFQRSTELLKTEPTNTNVNDLTLFLVW
ncbi:glycerate kinase [Candidatus Chlorohelix sp.]|uniref:glycerate kinase type-2 family protein n=1 Tax=Candidatus Chlorohelix sp. TaxID=3139201 RepID=UPI003068B5F1